MTFRRPTFFAPPREDRKELRAFRDAQIRRLVTRAYQEIPYYRSLLDAHGVAPGDVRGIEDLHRVPITDRATIQALSTEEVTGPGLDEEDLVVTRTSGSSGRPVTIRRTVEEADTVRSVAMRALTYLGIRPFETRASVRLPGQMRPVPPTLARLYPQVEIDCFQTPEEILAEVMACSPRVLGGYPGVLARLAPAVSPEKREALDLRLVMTGGEVLTPVMRRRISEAFGAPVRETYGTHEHGMLAFECLETGRLHVNDDLVVVEILRDGRPAEPGEDGEVVATALHSFAQPFIRYRLGDLATRGPVRCPCGSPFTTLETVRGRMIDHFPLPDGRVLHPYEIVVVLTRRNPWILQYHLVQERKDRIVVEVVSAEAPDPQAVSRLRSDIRDVVGPEVTVEVRRVERIEQTPGGKHRASRSEVYSFYAEEETT